MPTKRKPPKPELVAPVGPFLAAIEEWVAREVSRRRAHAFAGIVIGAHPRYPVEQTARRALAERAGINRHLFDEWFSGQRLHIDIVRADRLAMALDIPLRCLAEEFKPEAKWEAEAEVAA